MTHPAPTAAQLAAALRTLADAIETAPDWLVHNVMRTCAPSMELVAKYTRTQRTIRDGFACRHCERDGTVSMFDTVRELYLHARGTHRDLMAARALKAVRA